QPCTRNGWRVTTQPSGKRTAHFQPFFYYEFTNYLLVIRKKRNFLAMQPKGYNRYPSEVMVWTAAFNTLRVGRF
ncbi:MAG: hypothetical protein KAY91_00385, partial [Rhodocyclaceae bacterium]|nr:hypothetical protein [Rhodocyclaceae bacterium]